MFGSLLNAVEYRFSVMRRVVGSARFAFLCVAGSALLLLIPSVARAQIPLLDPGWQFAPQGNQDSGVSSGFIARTFGGNQGQNVVARPYQPAQAYGAPSYQAPPRGYQSGTPYYVVARPQYHAPGQPPGGYQQPGAHYYAAPAQQGRGLPPPPAYSQQQPQPSYQPAPTYAPQPVIAAPGPAYQAAPQYDQPPTFLMQLFGRRDSSPAYAPSLAYAPSGAGDMVHPAVDPKYDRQLVDYPTGQPPGTIIIDTPHYFLYLVQEGGKALRYGIGVGRPGFAWAGIKEVSAMRAWPDWRPPDEMLRRRPDLPRYMPGGPDNPLGARAIYLGSTLYRIHGSNEPWTIGTQVSSGCIRLRNEDVIDLYGRVKVGAKVIVI